MGIAREQIGQTIRRLIVERLHIEGLEIDEVSDDASLGMEIGLDSVDALELAVALEQEFSVKIVGAGIDKDSFASIRALTEFVQSRIAAEQSTG